MKKLTTLPFKPLTIAMTVSSVICAYAPNVFAETYGIHANNADISVTEYNFESKDYGVAAEKGFSATVNSNNDIKINATKGGAYIKDNGWGTINLTTSKNIEIVSANGSSIFSGLYLGPKTKSTEDLFLSTTSKNLIIKGTADTTARAININGHSNSSSTAKLTYGTVEINVENIVDINSTAGSYTKGIHAEGFNAKVDVTAKTINIKSITTGNKGKYAYGLSAHSDGIISASADYIDISSQVNSSGDAITVYAKSGPRLNERTTQIDLDAKESIILHATSAEDSTGITSTIFSEGSSAASFVNLNSKTTKLVATGSDTFGIATYASEISTAPIVNVNSSQIEIDATGKKAATGVYSGSNSVVNIGNKDADLIKISASSENKDQSNAENYAFGIWVENNVVAKTDPSDKENPETLSTIAGEVNVTGKNVLITAEGDNDVRGVFVASNLLSPKKRATLNIVADNIRIEATNTGKTQKSEGISAMSTGAVNLEGNTFIKADYAILARGDASVQINKDGKHSTQLEGNIVFDYDGPSSGTGINANVDVTLSGTESYWKGNTMIHWNGLPNSNAKDSDTADLLKVTDMKLTVQNGAEWIPTSVESTDAEAQNGQRAQALNSLTLDKGVVKVDSKVNVNVEKMTGTGTVKLATDLTAEEGAQAGTFTVGSAAEDSALTVKLTNADMTKDLTSDDVTADQAKKLIGNVAAADAEKTLVVDEGMYNAGFDVTEEGSTISHGPNSVMQSTLELASAAPLALNRILTNDVHKRMGDIRSLKQTSGPGCAMTAASFRAKTALTTTSTRSKWASTRCPPLMPRASVSRSPTR